MACSSTRTCGSKSRYRSGQPEPALPHDLDVAALNVEHVEVGAEAARPVQPAAGVGDERQPVAPAQILGAQHVAVDELEDERVVLRQRRDEPRPDAGLGRRDRVVHLVRAVDREQAGVLAGDADDVRVSPARRHLVVRVRQPARERLDGGDVL